jgi:hypothetical protein
MKAKKNELITLMKSSIKKAFSNILTYTDNFYKIIPVPILEPLGSVNKLFKNKFQF